ncbi:putative cargo-transport protein [Escovopsis weberi]|uniref:Putative cargo-transport protein n=1 Tax=Escovopsis weberi TaxID=150374 RepID=A0A0M8MX02_ESCWE|nr:putative cargo-transport protein [Escovopsis weberi]
MTAKGARYVEQLDDARCEGAWAELPELARKVRKHMPGRECIASTAEAESAIAQATTGGSRPSPSATTRNLDITNRVPKLESVIESESSFPEDRYQAQVCLGWLHWVVGEYDRAMNRLPTGGPDETEGPTTEWTTVCTLKAAYLRANIYMRDGQRSQALAALQAAQPSLARVWSGQAIRKQLRYWSELLLTEHCMLASEALHSNETGVDNPDSIACFRSWSRYWEVMSAPVTGGFGFKGSVPRRRIWNEYYLVLSRILENDLPFGTENVGTDLSGRSQLRVELRRAESAYQALLLHETTFPRADEERTEIEAFVKQVMTNWTILCGRGWSERDLGHGGRQAISRGVLDILYGAATRTYHSTSILRSLFIVHLAVAEFDLAFKALDSYLEIVKKGRARVEKTGHPEPSLDDEATVIETTAQAVLALCRYGHYEAAEKARQLAGELEEWLAKLPQTRSQDHNTPPRIETEPEHEGRSNVPPQTIALAWQAAGLAHANWSRKTSDAGGRGDIQAKAIRCLRRSLAPEFGRSKDVRSFFSLGLLLAERRELVAAIEIVRTSLIASHGYEEDYNLFYGPYWLERSLMPMWHLLALLLTARQDYIMASKACEGVFEQFKDPTVLFGKADGSFRSEHLNDMSGGSEGGRGLVDEMDDLEKEGILDVKMTQLALVELLEGPDVAVSASYDLLTLFARLFGPTDVEPRMRPPVVHEPPKTSATFRTIKAGIFGSHRLRPGTRQPTALTVDDKQVSNMPVRPATSHAPQASASPTLQVGGDGAQGDDDPTRSRSESLGQPRHRSESRRRNSLKKKQQPPRNPSRQRSSSAGGASHHVVDGEGAAAGQSHDFFSSGGRRLQSRIANQRGNTLSSLTSYLSGNSRPTDISDLTADATLALPCLFPIVSVPQDKGRYQRLSILVKVWLMIGGFYRRAGALDDCQEAIFEAQKLVESIEKELCKGEHEGLGGAGKPSAWAERKSIDELWADVHSELGQLSLARQNPEKLLPTPAIPPLDGQTEPHETKSYFYSDSYSEKPEVKPLPCTPLGLGSELSASEPAADKNDETESKDDETDKSVDEDENQLPTPYKATRLPLMDRLAARDRANTLLSGLTRLGTGWAYSDAWFALARAHEENGQVEKAKEVLWWCVELEEARGIRDWRSLAGGGYVL